MIKSLLKNPLFMPGFLFIVLLLAASFVHAIFFDSVIPNMKLLYKHGELVANTPFTPSQYPPFGSNNSGDNLFFIILMGAKYTIGVAIVVAALRLVVSIVLGVLYGNYFMKVNRYVSKVVDAFHYLPIALLAYFILKTALMSNGMTQAFAYSYTARIIFELVILTLVALPTTTLLIGNETSLILEKEYIVGAKIMGGSRLHIIRKHVIPHLIPKLWIQFTQQIIQVLILLIHLGVLHLLFGGTLVKMGPGGTNYISLNGEWSGLIGKSIEHLSLYPWIPLVPLVAFACTMLAFNLVLEGLKTVVEERDLPKRKKKRKRRTATRPATVQPSFEFVQRDRQMNG
ncbi:MAG TPA: ABC transporter permease subunit [Bacillales bacterium]|nr:ABC transporter permease subunit [Bacillales bacterium]